MKKNSQKNSDWSDRYQALEGSCQLWIAANEAKDERIEELERECEQLRRRVGRLSRMVGRRGSTARRVSTQAPLKRNPTMA